MQRLTNIYKKLADTGYPVAYRKHKKLVSTPFIVYFAEYTTVPGDDENYHKMLDITIELYTDKKDLQAESKVEEALKGHKFEHYEIEIETEDLIQNNYTIRMM